MLKELSENYEECSWNYISLKKDIETMNKKHLEMKNTISEMTNKLKEVKVD